MPNRRNLPSNGHNNDDFNKDKTWRNIGILAAIAFGVLTLGPVLPFLAPFALPAGIVFFVNHVKKNNQRKLLAATQQNTLRLALPGMSLQQLQSAVLQDPTLALWAIENNPAFRMYFNDILTKGVLAVTANNKSSSWAQESFFASSQSQPAPTSLPASVQPGLSSHAAQQLAHALKEANIAFQKLLSPLLYTADKRVALDIYLTGYICFFADVYLYETNLGTSFLQMYARTMQNRFVHIAHFTELSVQAYKAFVNAAEDLRQKLPDPLSFLNGYAKLLLSLLSLSADNTQLTNELVKHTASLQAVYENSYTKNIADTNPMLL